MLNQSAMTKLLYNIIFFSCLLRSQQSYEDFLLQQQQGFDQYRQSITNEYLAYEKAEKDAFDQFKKDVELQWNQFKGSTPKTYVSYDDDLQSRASIDYENGKLLVEVILDKNIFESEKINYFDGGILPPHRLGSRNPTIIGNYLSIMCSFVIPLLQNADHVKQELADNETRPLFQGLAKTKIIQKLVKVLAEKDDDGNVILDKQLADINGNNINSNNVENFAERHLKKQLKTSKDYKAKNGKGKKLFTLSLNLKSDHLDSRIKKYGKEIIKQANRFNIDPAIALAITETESSFNPKATSHIPAYGLMQLVPSSGARDAYRYVYKKDKVLKKGFLYKPKNNIELGCAYLAKIRYDYFKSVRDDNSAYMCTIAAYNTGIGNVAKALTGKGKIKPATTRANQLNSNQVYNTLIRDLKYEETRNYLKKVWARKDKYL